MEKMKPGRKTLDPKNIQFKILLSEDEMSMINHCSKATGKTKSEIVRRLIKEEYQRIKENE